jgi:hypothetical protein
MIYVIYIGVYSVKLYKKNTQGFSQCCCVPFIVCLDDSEHLYKSYSYALYLLLCYIYVAEIIVIR